MPSLTMLFTVMMLPGVCLLAASFIVSAFESKKKSIHRLS